MTPKKVGPHCKLAATSKYTAGNIISSARATTANMHMRPKVHVKSGDFTSKFFVSFMIEVV
jgi:hypothetical protein